MGEPRLARIDSRRGREGGPSMGKQSRPNIFFPHVSSEPSWAASNALAEWERGALLSFAIE